MDQSEHGAHERNKLRGAIAEMTLRVAEVSAKGETDADARPIERLEKSWQALMALIEPEPEPTQRQSPHCHGQMRQNALCKSAPPGAGAA